MDGQREWVLDEQESRPFIRQAIEGGINFFDTADIYFFGGSEEILGRALKEFGLSRDRLVIATKVFNAMGDDPYQRGLSRKHIFHAIEDSLRRLKTDYVDLYQIHRFDPATPIEETLETLHDLVRAGKVRYLGASSMWAWQFAKMRHVSQQHGWTHVCGSNLDAGKAARIQNFKDFPHGVEVRPRGVGCCGGRRIGHASAAR